MQARERRGGLLAKILKEQPEPCSDHHYEKLNDHTVFCPGCGDMKTAPAEVAPYVPVPSWPRCSVCGQPLYTTHYHLGGSYPPSYWPGWMTWTSGTSGNVTIYPLSDTTTTAGGTLT